MWQVYIEKKDGAVVKLMDIQVQVFGQPSSLLELILNMGPPLVMFAYALMTILVVYLAYRYMCERNANRKPEDQ